MTPVPPTNFSVLAYSYVNTFGRPLGAPGTSSTVDDVLVNLYSDTKGKTLVASLRFNNLQSVSVPDWRPSPNPGMSAYNVEAPLTLLPMVMTALAQLSTKGVKLQLQWRGPYPGGFLMLLGPPVLVKNGAKVRKTKEKKLDRVRNNWSLKRRRS